MTASSCTNTIGSPLPGRDLLQRADHAADDGRSRRPPRGHVRQPAVRLARELILHCGERMLGDVDPERLLLERQGGNFSNSPAGISGCTFGADDSSPPRSKIEPWPSSRSACSRRPTRVRGRSPRASAPRRPVESSAPHLISASSARLFATVVDPFREIPEGGKRVPALARGDNRRRGCLPHVLYGIEPEADLSLHDGEVPLGRVDVRRLDRDPHLGAGVHVERHAVLVFITDEISAAMYSHGWFAFSQAVRYDQGVTGRVRLVERVVL